MTSFPERMIGAAKLNIAIYEEVEADGTATWQAMGVVLLSVLAAGVGSAALGAEIIASAVIALVWWVIWAFLTYLVGTRLLPEPQTHANLGQMMRTMGFAQSPGVLRILGGLPVIGLPLLAIVSLWNLVTMVIAVRQALDYTSTWRAVAVVVGALVAAVAAISVLGLLFEVLAALVGG